jgi:hypothetical protein
MESQEDQTQPREGKKVALVGFADSWKLAPFGIRPSRSGG